MVRLLAEDTVDALVVEQQKWKIESGSGAIQADEIDHGTIVTLGDLLRGTADGTGGGIAAGAEEHNGAAPSPAVDANGAGPSGVSRKSRRG